LDDAGGVASADAASDDAKNLGVELIQDGVGVGVAVLKRFEEIGAEPEVSRLGELEAFGGGEVVVEEAGKTEGVGAGRVSEGPQVARRRRLRC
jgi:hypothetical protein